MANKKEFLEVGDTIVCSVNIGFRTITDFHATIAKIAYQEPYSWRGAYYLEFWDTNGTYRSWKQNYDGGHVIYVGGESK